MCSQDGPPLCLGGKLCWSTQLQVFSSFLGRSSRHVLCYKMKICLAFSKLFFPFTNQQNYSGLFLILGIDLDSL